MSNSLAKVWDDWDRYESLCKENGIESLPMHNDLTGQETGWYKHYYELLEKTK